MKITGIKAQTRNADRVSIYVDGKYAFSLNHTQLLDQRLHAGLELTDARLAELKHTSDFGKAYERSLLFAMLRPRSVREMQDYFRRKKIVPEDAEVILQKLCSRNYVDDRNFARSWVESRALGKKTSAKKMRLELKQKGIADDVIAEVLTTNQTYNEQEALLSLVTKKRRQTKYQDRNKLLQYLARQGFAFDDIVRAIDT